MKRVICWLFGHQPLALDRRDWTIRCPRFGWRVLRSGLRP